MSNRLWPPISDDEREIKEAETQQAELIWLLDVLHETLPSLKSGLQECLSLLSSPNPTTLPLSSHKSEALKGVITRIGSRITQGSISLRLSALPPPKGLAAFPLRIEDAAKLPQLATLLTLLNTSLDVLDVMSWTGDPRDSSFVSGQLRLLAETIDEAHATIRGGPDVPGCTWWQGDMDDDSAWGELPESLVPHLYVEEAALVLTVRTLGPAQKDGDFLESFTGLGLRTRLGLQARPQAHDEMEQVFVWKGGEVGVRDKVRVESQDPSLMSVMAKLAAVGREVRSWRVKVDVVRGEEIDV